MRLVGHVARMGEKSWLGSLIGRPHPQDLDEVGRIILKRVLGKRSLRVWTAYIWLKIGTGVGFCERCDEHSGSEATKLVAEMGVPLASKHELRSHSY